MSLYNRYYILKMKEPDYMTLFVKEKAKYKYISWGIDKEILYSLKKNISVEKQLQKLNINYQYTKYYFLFAIKK